MLQFPNRKQFMLPNALCIDPQGRHALLD